MQFFTAALAASSLALAASAAIVPSSSSGTSQMSKREDYRQLVSFASNPDFCKQWKCACVNYVPQNQQLVFLGTVCEPGDYHGQNMDTEAKVDCLFTDGKKTQSIFNHIAAETGATAVSQ